MSEILTKEKFLHIKVFFHDFTAVIGLISVVLHILFSPNPSISMIKFTIYSNTIVAITFALSAYLLRVKKKESRILDLIKHASLIYMMVVFLTYHFILASEGEYSGMRVITNFTLHYVVPMFVLINWILFERKKWLSYKSTLFWLIFPVLYTAVSLIRGAVDGVYPYFFLNPSGQIPDGIGSYANVFLFNIGFTLVFLVLGFLLIFINRGILRFKNDKFPPTKILKM